MKRFSCLLVLSMLAAAKLPAKAAVLLVNGGFENNKLSSQTPSANPPTGWTETGNNGTGTGNGEAVLYSSLSPKVQNLNISYGNNVFKFVQGAAGTLLSQSIATVPGQRYQLEFVYGLAGGTGTETLKVSASSGATVDKTTTFQASQSSVQTNLSLIYIPETFNFIALGTTTTISFEDLTGTGQVSSQGVGLLDSVRIAVPEPSMNGFLVSAAGILCCLIFGRTRKLGGPG